MPAATARWQPHEIFGAMDGAIRGNMFRHVQRRGMEWQKLIWTTGYIHEVAQFFATG